MGRSADSFPRLIPRRVRLRDAPFYLGMGRNRFNGGPPVSH